VDLGLSIPANTPNASVTGLTAGTTYTFRIKARSSIADSDYSNEASVTIPSIPNPPSQLTASAVTVTSAELEWKDNSSNESEFRIESKAASGSFADTGQAISAGATRATVPGLVSGMPYTFRIRARNAVGDSGYSNEAKVTIPEAGPCTVNATTLCLKGGRFRVQTTWSTKDGASGPGQGVKLTEETGYFWFFSSTNVEMVVKVLNGCIPGFNSYWVFAGGLTDVGVVTSVTDTNRGIVKQYTNPLTIPLGTPFQPIQDTSALATCP
jgi:hypothetical protein